MKTKFRTSILLVIFAFFSVTLAAQKNEEISTKHLGTYKKASTIWKNLLVPRKLNQTQLLKLAQELHKTEPTINFRLFDDDKQFQSFMDWDINYPNPAYPWPQKWVKEHHVANIQPMAYDTSGPKWAILKGYTSEKIADLE